MNEEIFLRFLYESESDSLDFKRDQYKFTNANDDEKSELLKDILAMVNSWRSVDGYIIIGLIDKPEKPNKLYGIKEHVDDSRLQQFVNSKTTKICSFEYKTFPYEGLTFGIFRIPIQNRPIYLKKDFGKLKKDTVYVRRGSSTDEAKIDEISQMGKTIVEELRRPQLNINFTNNDDGSVFGKTIEAKVKHLDVLEGIPDYRIIRTGFYIDTGMENVNYYREFYQYIKFNTSFKPFYFQIENTGNIEAKNIKIEITFPEIDIELKQDGDEIKEPEKDKLNFIVNATYTPYHSEFYVERKNNRIIVFSTINILHAKRSLELDGTIYINPLRKRTIPCEVKIFCDGIENPFHYHMSIVFEYKSIELTWVEYKKYLNEKNILI